MDELACRCATFINDCDVVNFVARHGVYFRRMLSPIGRNSLPDHNLKLIQFQDVVSISQNIHLAIE